MEVIIKSPDKKYLLNKKILGLYPLERNIKLFWHFGISEFYLNINPNEKSFFEKKIKKRLSHLKNLKIYFSKPKNNEDLFIIHSNDFLDYAFLNQKDKYFQKKETNYIPIYNNELFPLCDLKSFKLAGKTGRERIRMSAGGIIARNVNKRISLPISRMLAFFRISPNVITFINLIIGWSAAYFFTRNNYLSIAIAGTLFQFASIFDGCDGEVAKMTMKFSKYGGIFDTFNDYSTLVINSVAVSYLLVLKKGASAYIVFTLLIIPMLLIILSLLLYVIRNSKSRSLAAIEKELLVFLAPYSFTVRFISKACYVTKKEFYSYLTMFMAWANIVHYLTFIYALILNVGLLLLWIILFYIKPKYKDVLNNSNINQMQYISSRE